MPPRNGVNMTLQGDVQLRRFLSRVPGDVRMLFIDKAVKGAAHVGVRAAKSATPEGPTGNLKRSIGFKKVRGAKNNPFFYSML